jgi:hypothetical protein
MFAVTHLGNAGQRGLGCEEGISSGVQLLHLLRSEGVCPLLGMVAVVLGLPYRRAGDLTGELVEGTDLLVERWVLAGSLQAIGEDV